MAITSSRLSNQNKKLTLVTGASGLLGVNLLTEAQRSNREVVGLCYRHALTMNGVALYSIDITDHATLRSLLWKLQPTSIIHCAAATSLDWCEDHPDDAERMNVQATKFLAMFAQQINAQFLYVSTDAVFDGERGNYSEEASPNPLNVYAKSKLQGEFEAFQWHRSPIVVRIASIYGWNAQPKRSIGEWFMEEIRAGRTVTGFTDAHFCPMFANDTAEILLAMIDHRLEGLYHVASSDRISKFEFARRIAVEFDLTTQCIIPGTVVQAVLRAQRSRDVSLCTKKIQTTLGRPMPSVDAGVQRFRSLRESGYADLIRSFYLQSSIDPIDS
jgi:dTDP-4-dehydrorhamnose reductase